MLCEKCKQNPATVHVQKNVNGVTETHALCPACAAETAGVQLDISVEDLFKGFLGSMFAMAGQAQKQAAQDAPKEPVCESCGLSFGAFRKAGRFGCGKCYDAFRPQVEASLKSVHGATRHEGKLPNRLSAELLYKRELVHSRDALRKAVEQENYEEAARLRDRIRVLEKQEVQG